MPKNIQNGGYCEAGEISEFYDYDYPWPDGDFGAWRRCVGNDNPAPEVITKNGGGKCP